MTDNEMAEARRLVRFGIEQGWISQPAGSNGVEWWDRSKAKQEDPKDPLNATQSIERTSEAEQ